MYRSQPGMAKRPHTASMGGRCALRAEAGGEIPWCMAHPAIKPLVRASHHRNSQAGLALAHRSMALCQTTEIIPEE